MSATTKPTKYRINKRFLSTLKPPESGEKIYWDDELRGFGIRVLASGIKSYIYYRRLAPTDQYKVTLGRVGELTTLRAREKATSLAGDLANGKNPIADRRKAKANTFGKLAEEYIQHRCSKKKSGPEDERMIRKDLLPTWGTLPTKDITRRMVIELTDNIKARGAEIGANRTLSCIKRVFNFGIGRDLTDYNPARQVEKPAEEKKRDRVLTDEEIRVVWTRLPDMKRAGGRVEAALKLLLVTAQRRGEVMSMEWSDIENNTWTIPAERSKNGKAHRVPLSPLALSILAEIPRVEGRVFPLSLRAVTLAVNVNQDLFDIPHWTPHDLRRTAASRIASMGFSRTTLSKVLNHVEQSVTAIYDRYTYDAEKRLALDDWADKLQRILEDRSADVIPIPMVK